METTGQQMHDGDQETRREAARAMGQARTPAKSAAAKARGAVLRGVPLSEEHRAKLRAAQQRRRAREAEQK